MRLTGDEPQGTMGRVQTSGEAPSRPLFPSRLPLRAHRKRDVWVRGSVATAKRAKTAVWFSLIGLKRARDLRADNQVYQCKSEATSQFLLTIKRLPLYFEVKQFASLSSFSCWNNSSRGLSSCISLGWSFSLSYTWPALSSIISLSLVISCWSLSDYVLRKQNNECQYKERRLPCQLKKQLFFRVRQHARWNSRNTHSQHCYNTVVRYFNTLLVLNFAILARHYSAGFYFAS